MARIKKLSPLEAQKIAAGEVVERPAHIVKELIENALDAGATEITIALEDGGKSLIQITDNGCGMSEDDLQLSIQPYATSKIDSVSDLPTLLTFGFRGEALASIAAVSKLEIISKESSNAQAHCLFADGGIVTAVNLVAAPDGTRISIRELFYNVPARRKFLRKRDTELNLITHFVHAFCLSNLTVHFKFFHEGHLLLNCPPAASLLGRIAHIWNQSITTHMLELQTHENFLNAHCLHGAISEWQLQRYDRSHQFVFINGRLIKNYQLTTAINKGYQNILPPGRFPAFCILISIDPQVIDVNVHPRKEEVQFLHPQTIINSLEKAIVTTLENATNKRLQEKSASSPAPAQLASPNMQPFFEKARVALPYAQDSFSLQASAATYPATVPTELAVTSAVKQTETVLAHQTFVTQTPEATSIIGQYETTYILTQSDTGLLLVDQHAAHERILYEQLNTHQKMGDPIELLFPALVPIKASDYQLIEPYLIMLEENGIHAQQFSSTQLMISATPAQLQNINFNELIYQLIGWIVESDTLDKAEVKKLLCQKLHAQIACKAAIKAGDVLSMQQMKELIAQLQKTNNRYTCPHGRPTSWLIPLTEIERKFKRRL